MPSDAAAPERAGQRVPCGAPARFAARKRAACRACVGAGAARGAGHTARAGRVGESSLHLRANQLGGEAAGTFPE